MRELPLAVETEDEEDVTLSLAAPLPLVDVLDTPPFPLGREEGADSGL